jgi:hypothetical protein
MVSAIVSRREARVPNNGAGYGKTSTTRNDYRESSRIEQSVLQCLR